MNRAQIIIQEMRFAYQPKYPNDSLSMRKGDIYHVFHGFRSPEAAILTATRGLSGKSKADRVYSYEANNNPRGLFVTPDIKKAKEFVGGISPGVIIEFAAREEDLEPPVWPSGSFTGQGQMASYWKSPGERRRAQVSLNKEFASDPEIGRHHRPGLASTFLYSGERQALFTGALNPNQIQRFWVASEPEGRLKVNSTYVPMKRVDFLNFVKDQERPKDPEGRKLFRPNDRFDPSLFLTQLIKTFRMKGSQEEVLNRIRMIFRTEISRKVPFEVSSFGKLVWPKQQPDLFRWLKNI